jgi:MoxR-like ATPase
VKESTASFSAARRLDHDADVVDPRNDNTAKRATRFAQNFEALLHNVSTVVKGKTHAIRMALTCLFAEGHLLIEDVPGTGKTTMAKAMAQSIDGTWQRIQFTPGGVFANVVIADEINRASPKTQSALLEVMEEHQVTVDSTPYLVPRPFIVIATQNPVEHDGTYDLPEAQIDRFMMRLSIGYPDLDDEVEILANDAGGSRVEDLHAVLSAPEVRRMIALTDRIYVAPKLQQYIVHVTSSTRALTELRLGVSPRGSVALARAARAYAAANGRPFVTADDVKELAPLVLSHRMILTPEGELAGNRPAELLDHILESVPVPQERVEL